MSTLDQIKEYGLSIWQGIIQQSKRIILPFFDGLSLFDVSSFFFKGLFEGVITTRAGSTSWSFFLAMFPAIIFIFNLIPYIPINGMNEEIFLILKEVLPPTTYELVSSTIEDILTHRRADLLSYTFIATIFFATNGTMSLISNFNISFHQLESRAFWQQYLVALGLTVVLGLLIIIGVAAVLFSTNFTEWMVAKEYLPERFTDLIQIGRYLILMVVMFLAISMIFYYGPSKKREWRLFSPGAIMATVLIILSSFAFSFYVDNFSNYNRLYGSIGALLVIMLWIYINSIGLIVGFELNASIAGAKKRRNRLDTLE
ncbi:MAG: YihY/virulence factor BrkB family protein [Bacteroidetes bacterium]|nr:MAG: YihY/virulence factor BrkB family protein [Bacteroidota bacterium]